MLFKKWPLVAMLGVLMSGCATVFTEDDLSYIFLEEVRGKEALEWVEAENQRTLEQVGTSAHFFTLEKEALKILEAKDNLTYGSLRDGFMYNFWQDEKNVLGLWRRTPLSSYKSGKPKWETLIDLDQLGKKEKVPWVYKGVTCEAPPVQRCLVRLSATGKDAVVLREFDLKTKKFVTDGFNAPEAKTSVLFENRDSVLIATDFGPGSLSKSGYPIVVKRWKRGEPLKDAEEVFRGDTEDMGVFVFRADTPSGSEYFLSHYLSFYKVQTYWLKDGWQKLPVPEMHEGVDVFKGRYLFSIKEPWKGFNAGSILAVPLAKGENEPELIYAPEKNESLVGSTASENYLLTMVSKDVSTKIKSFHLSEGQWVKGEVQLPADVEASIMTVPLEGDEVYFTATGFLTPTQILVGDIKENRFKTIYTLPSRFNSKGLSVEQRFAVSKDGTKVPYHVIYNKELLTSKGPLPTLLYGYGGFEVSLTPGYGALEGKLWLEKGGAYAVANIRGGGEYGPKWHQAALKFNRHKAYEDFFAVAEDLAKQKITTPSQLGIMGGSNGGLLTGVAYTQRPDLFGAVISSVPLLDMLRYHKLLAGASWMDEYGDPDKAKERMYLRSYSPFHNVISEKSYPPLLLITSTEDDRVHPGHARKMAHRVKDQGHKYFYYENTMGGHAAGSDKKQAAKLAALKYSFLESVLKGQN